MDILLAILTFILIAISLFLILVVLAQKAKNDGGMGAAMGGGMAEAAFGADTGNVLSKATINAAIAFFILAFALYLGRIYQRTHATANADALPTITAPVGAKAATTPGADASKAANPGQPATTTAQPVAPANQTTTPPQNAPAKQP